jgi:hypothetical protein
VCAELLVKELTLLFLSLITKLFSHLTSSLIFRTVVEFYYSVYPCPSETFRGSNFYVVFLIALFYPLSFCDKKGE